MRKEGYQKTDDFIDEVKKLSCDKAFLLVDVKQEDAQDDREGAIVPCKHVLTLLQLTAISPDEKAYITHTTAIGDAMIATEEEFTAYREGCLTKRTEIVSQIQRFAPKCRIFEGVTSP